MAKHQQAEEQVASHPHQIAEDLPPPAPVAESAPVAKATKQPTVYTAVTMADGRTVQFAGKKTLLKEVTTDAENGEVLVRFDFRNGQTRTIVGSTLSNEITLRALGHGLSQKVGDECASIDEVDDMVVAVDEMIARLQAGEWAARREAGDSFNGASIVVKAVAEASGKTVEFVKNFLQKKIDDAAKAGQKLTRAELYKSFRTPGSKTAAIIARLEAEKAAKSTSSVDAGALLDELGV